MGGEAGVDGHFTDVKEEEEKTEFDHGEFDYSPYSDDEEGKEEEEDDIMDDFANAELREAQVQEVLR